MEGRGIQNLDEMVAEADGERKEFAKRALEGKARWGAWRYNPHNLTLEFDPKLSDSPEDESYYVDLERCNSSAEILDWLLQIMEKNWSTPEQVGYLLKGMNELAGDLHDVLWDRRFNMGKRIRDLMRESEQGVLKVHEVADILRVNKLTVYRMVKDKRLKAIRLPIGRDGELRIPQEEVDKILGRRNSKGKG